MAAKKKAMKTTTMKTMTMKIMMTLHLHMEVLSCNIGRQEHQMLSIPTLYLLGRCVSLRTYMWTLQSDYLGIIA